MNNKKNQKFSRNNQIYKTKSLNTISIQKIPVTLSFRVHNNKTIYVKKNNIDFKKIIYSNIQKYNINNNDYDIIKINDLVDSKSCHLIAIFKDYLISDYIEEFLQRFYKRKESKTRIPKFVDYYKNYLKFFCNPTFSDFFSNNIIQELGEAKAEIYYNNNYGNKNKEKKEEVNKDIIFDTIVKESIDYMIKDTRDYFTTINSQETINLPDETVLIINGVNKNSNENSITSILNCFSSPDIINQNQTNKNNEEKNIIKKNLSSISIENKLNNIHVRRTNNKCKTNLFKPISTIQTSTRINSDNKNVLKKEEKNLKINQNEVLNNKNKSISKEISNNKILKSQLSNSNFSRNKNKLNLHNSKNNNNKIYLTTTPTKTKKKSVDNKLNKNNNNLNKNNGNLNLQDIMKLTLQIYNEKIKNGNIQKNNNEINVKINNNNRIIHHQHTRSSPIINNINININNNICLQNTNSQNSLNIMNNTDNKSSPIKNSRNKEHFFIRVNTDSHKRINAYSTNSNFYNYSTNNNKEIDSFLKNSLFSTYNNGIKVEKSKKENKKYSNNDIYIKENHLSPMKNNTNLNSIYEQLQKNNIFSPQSNRNKGILINNTLKNQLNNYNRKNIIIEKKKKK